MLTDQPRLAAYTMVYIKFLDISNNWSGVLRFGFTSNDPSNLRYSLPKYACPDLTSKPGYWAKALAERFAERGTVLYYYVNQMGDVYFGINGEEKGIFLSGVETRDPLWALFDVYGNSTGIELIDRRIPLNNSRRSVQGSQDSSPDVDAQLSSPFQSMCIQNANQRPEGSENQSDSNALSRYHQAETGLAPLPFHRTRGRNVLLSNDRCIATRVDTEFCLGYVFTSRPVQLGEKIIIQVVARETMYAGGLAFGLTSCDPDTLDMSVLPEDSNSLLDRREYWVVQKDVASTPQIGDELVFSVLHTGEVQFSKNGGQPIVFMHVDQTLQLWAFFDIYGTTQKIRVLGSVPPPPSHSSSPALWVRQEDTVNRRRMRVNSMLPSDPSNGGPIINGGNTHVSVQNSQSNVPHRHCCTTGSTAPAEVVQFQPTMGGGTVLVVNLPPAHSNFINHQQQQQQQQQQPQPLRSSPPPSCNSHNSHQEVHNTNTNGFNRLPTSSGTMVSNYNSSYIEPISSGSYPTVDSNIQWNEGTSSECSICYERSIDSVLYMCGHMCMCYECAVQQWRGKGGGHCPLCRAVIRDVIRTYKS
ncbi:hypothetical protein RUM43_007243 [Polyplax serrata]|uniref:Protein neuralized n=1 Tax=Polyplax serrata TaxID=468196 RepID=A0AAN8S1D0_POLSC